MVNPTQDQLFERWDLVPENLREAIFSEANSDFIWKACENEHIPDEKIYIVAKLVGYALMGFLHPEDLAVEVKERLGIDVRTANAVEEALNGRIFAPLRPSIDKIYAPVSKLGASSAGLTPKMLQDLGAAPTTSAPVAMPKPSVVSDVGWSRKPAPPAVPIAPTIKPDALQVSWIVPTPAPKPLSETAASAAAAAQNSEPAPVMLHQDTTFKAPEKNAGFTLTRPGSGAEVSMGQTPSAAPSRPAVLEFGGAQQPQAKPPTPAAVHYTAFTEGPRNVSQVSPSVPPTPPSPPMPPKPPVPPTMPQTAPQPPQPPQKNNTIVKDFL